MKTLLEQFLSNFENENKEFWEEYNKKEKEVFEKLIKIDKHPILDTVKGFSEKFDMDIVMFVGFLYGINDSLKIPNNIKELEENTIVTLDYDEKLLYKNMLDAGCDMSVWGEDIDTDEYKLEKAKSIVANAKAKEWLNQVHCPYCNSTNCKKISGISKATSVAIFGLFSQKVKKQWHCNNCKSDF